MEGRDRATVALTAKLTKRHTDKGKVLHPGWPK